MKLIIILVLLMGNVSFAEESPEAPKAEAPKAPEGNAPVKQTSPSAVKYSVFGLVNMGGSIEFSSVKASSSTVSATGSFNFQIDNGLGIGFEARQSEEQSWGWAAGATYDFKRYANSSDASFAGASASAVYKEPRPSIAVFAPFVNGVYRWNKTSFVIGFNYAIPSFDQGSMTGTSALSGGIGGQFGLNFQATERISIDVLYRNFVIKGVRSADGFDFSLGDGYMRGVQLQGRYTF